MLVNFDKNYITLFATNFSRTHYNVFTYWVQNYKSCGHAERKTKIRDVHHLQERIVVERDKLDRHIIDKIVREWQKRLRVCVVAREGQFEHKMWKFCTAGILSCAIFEG